MLKAIRERKKYSQKELASLIGISQPSYSNIENGKRNPTVKTLRRIANVLNVSIDELLSPDPAAADASTTTND